MDGVIGKTEGRLKDYGLIVKKLQRALPNCITLRISMLLLHNSSQPPLALRGNI